MFKCEMLSEGMTIRSGGRIVLQRHDGLVTFENTSDMDMHLEVTYTEPNKYYVFDKEKYMKWWIAGHPNADELLIHSACHNAESKHGLTMTLSDYNKENEKEWCVERTSE